jgi:hypothetical protein
LLCWLWQWDSYTRSTQGRFLDTTTCTAIGQFSVNDSHAAQPADGFMPKVYKRKIKASHKPAITITRNALDEESLLATADKTRTRKDSVGFA